MNPRYVEINITADRVCVRGNLAEFEATALLQDAIAYQAKQKAVSRDRACSEFFRRYQAVLFYPIISAFFLGLCLTALLNSVSKADNYQVNPAGNTFIIRSH